MAAVMLAGCGSSASQSGLSASCAVAEIGAQIKLHNSGLSCVDAEAMVYLMTWESTGLEEIKGAGGAWRCKSPSTPEGMFHKRCHQGKRYFTVDRSAPPR